MLKEGEASAEKEDHRATLQELSLAMAEAGQRMETGQFSGHIID